MTCILGSCIYVLKVNICLIFVSSSSFLHQFVVDDDETKEWKVYDAGPRSVKCPLVCFPPASGTADVFFRQMLGLSAVGYRVISVSDKLYHFFLYK